MGTIVDTSKAFKMPTIETLPAEEPKEPTDSAGACGEPKLSKPPAISNLGLFDDEDNEDESIVERLCALTEMFPGSVRKSTSWLTNSLISSSKWCYGKSRTIVWAVATSAIILYLPVVLENERSSP